MITVNALGEACPMPVVKAKKAIDALTAPETVQVLVDNDAAVQNLIAARRTARASHDPRRRTGLRSSSTAVTLDRRRSCPSRRGRRSASSAPPLKPAQKNVVVAISADHMGEGERRAAARRCSRAFIFALTQQDALPIHDPLLQRRRERHQH